MRLASTGGQILKKNYLDHSGGDVSFKPPYTLTNKGSLLASMVPGRTFNINGNFSFYKKFFKVEKQVRMFVGNM